MKADDPRHGTTTGYRYGCHQPCCRAAVAAAAQKRRNRLYLERTTALTTSPVGTRRRIQALVALGWSLAEISRRAGYDRSHIPLMLRRGVVRKETARRIARIYDELSMRLPPSDTRSEKINVTRSKGIAARNGWLPPLAWNNIDDPAERPRIGRRGARKTDIDPVVIERILAGERVRATKAEKNEAMRRWKALGRSEKSLCDAQGWKDSRYGREESAA